MHTRVGVTFIPAAFPAEPRTITAAVAETGKALADLESTLGSCGVTVLSRARAAGIVRIASDPAVHGEVSRLLDTDISPDLESHLSWASARPIGADERWDCYQHDSGTLVAVNTTYTR